jgi:DNA-binding NarL/FixJ family response regulator
VILDLQLEDGSGLDVLKAVHPSASALHVAVLTNYATDQHRRACMDAGAEYFLDKSSDFPRIREIVQVDCLPRRRHPCTRQIRTRNQKPWEHNMTADMSH